MPAVAPLTAEQSNNAKIIVSVVRSRSLPKRASVIAIATALQESDLINMAGGDRDSVGLFQQRPSMGWGSIAQCRDPYYATNKFLDALLMVPGWQTLPLTVAAQKVQRSAYPLAYAKHEVRASAIVDAIDTSPVTKNGNSSGVGGGIPSVDWWARVLMALLGIVLIIISLVRMTGVNFI